MDSFVSLASDSKRQAERRNSNHRLYDVMQQTAYPENVTATDPSFDQSHQGPRSPLHLSVESHEREHTWDQPQSQDSSLTSSIVGVVQTIQSKIAEKLETFGVEHKQAQKASIIPSERIPVAADVIKAQQPTVVQSQHIPASQSPELAVPREKITVHLDQTKDLSSLGQRTEFSGSARPVVVERHSAPASDVRTALHKPLEVIDEAYHKSVDAVNHAIQKPHHSGFTKPLDPHISTGFSKELDVAEFDHEFEATLV